MSAQNTASPAAKVKKAELTAKQLGISAEPMLSALADSDPDVRDFLAARAAQALAAAVQPLTDLGWEALAQSLLDAQTAASVIDLNTVDGYVAQYGISDADFATAFPALASLRSQRSSRTHKTVNAHSALREEGGWELLASVERFWFAARTVGKSGLMKSAPVYCIDPAAHRIYFYTTKLRTVEADWSKVASQTGRVRGDDATKVFVDLVLHVAGIDGHDVDDDIVAAFIKLDDAGDPATMSTDELTAAFAARNI